MFFIIFNDTATTEIYTLSLHDALPIWAISSAIAPSARPAVHPIPVAISVFLYLLAVSQPILVKKTPKSNRSEEHTSELQSQSNLVCRLLLEKKKYKNNQLYN